MVAVSNGFLSGEVVIVSGIENGSCHGASALSSKWKPRNVSAFRDFPAGCGPVVQPLNVVSGEAAASSLLVDDKGVDSIVDNGVESLSQEMSKSTKDGEVGFFMECNEVEMKALVNNALQNGGNQAEMKDGVGGPVNGVVQVGGGKLLSPPKGIINGSDVNKGTVSKNRFTQTRIFAVRDYPPHCGLDATEPTEEERVRINGKRSVGVEDKNGGTSMRLREAVVVVGEESNGNVQNGIVQEPQSDEVSNVSRIAIQESGVGVKVGLGSERSTEEMTVVGKDSKRDVQDGKVHKSETVVIGAGPRNKLRFVSRKGSKVITGQLCKELEIYSRGKALKSKHSVDAAGEHSKEKFLDESVQNSESEEMVAIPSTRSLAIIQNGSKNISGQLREVGHEKYLKKRPLDDVDDLGCIREGRSIVPGLMASSFCPLRFVKANLIDPFDVTNRIKVKTRTPTTPKKSKKRNAAYGEQSVGEKSASVRKVAYTGTLDLVVRDEEDFIAHSEEQREDSPTSQGPHEVDVTLPPFGPKSSSDARNKVREALRLFQALCRKLLQEEEAKTKEGYESKSGQQGKALKRIDLVVMNILKEKGKELNTGLKILGPVPGVEVGDEFQYRVELSLVGIHRLYQAGIDFIKQGRDLVAVSIVASGGYDDELDNPDCLIYSGSGGIGRDKQPENQKLEGGNLALKNNIPQKHPVRVIRGYKETKAAESSDAKRKVVITYIYDGLYTVDRYWQEPGPHGNLIFKYELKRIPGQSELALKEVKKSKKYKAREGLCVDDITSGKELFQICAVNTIDSEKPQPFNYITKMIYPDWYRLLPPKGCDCAGRCSNKRCSCSFKNGGVIPYNHNGAIVEAKPLVYECGPSCKCPPNCKNRVTQHGIKIQLEIFKTESRGWGVRSLNSISSGSFICEYIGELLEDTEAEKRTGNDEYLFDIGQNYNDCSLNPDAKLSSSEVVEDGGFTIDAANYGNVGRFINHSCSPNLYAQNVLYDHEDKRMPHIMLFAVENIPPLQELTYHYNYAVNTVHDSDGNIKIKKCYCSSSECTGRLY